MTRKETLFLRSRFHNNTENNYRCYHIRFLADLPSSGDIFFIFTHSLMRVKKLVKDNSILKEIVTPGILGAVLNHYGIVEISWDSSIETIEVFHLKEMQRVVAELGNGKKMPLLFQPHDFLHLSKEAGKFATTDEGTRYSLAIAVLVDNIAKKLLMNFFMKMNKPKVTTRSFSNKEEALMWLKNL